MCGRFTQSSPNLYPAMFNIESGLLFGPRYNITPSQNILVCRTAELGWRELLPMKWGLLPHWLKEPKPSYSMINARAETVETKPAYRTAFKQRRCLIPTDGFFE